VCWLVSWLVDHLVVVREITKLLANYQTIQLL
jgi:hypothetical protein